MAVAADGTIYFGDVQAERAPEIRAGGRAFVLAAMMQMNLD